MKWPSLQTITGSLFARLSLVLLLGLGVAQWLSFHLQTGERTEAVYRARGQNLAARIAEVVRVLEASPAQERQNTFAALRGDDLHVQPLQAGEVAPHAPRGQMRGMLDAYLGEHHEVRSASNGMPQRDSPLRSFDVQLHDGQWVRIAVNLNPAPPALSPTFILYLVLSLAIVAVAVLIAIRQVSQPLQQLADAADMLGHNLNAPPLAEHGSTETRRAAQAFNRMQARIKHLIDERSRALAAVSHDLRTPLTRLRLRSEWIEDEALRKQMAGDLDSMASMLDSTLDYLRSLQENEAIRRIDMNALLQTLAEDASVLGKTISITGQARSPYPGRYTALRRALQNLCDNAIKYGGNASIRVEDSPTMLSITVEDEGPGIPEAELAKVTQPYYRVDASRNTATGGSGLGLSIVHDIALLHGGSLRLSNRPTGGLSASLNLPRAAA